MTTLRHVAVIDIGKTNAKVAVVDLQSNSEIAVRKQANHVLSGAPYPHYDVEKIWVFILNALSDLQRETSIDAISVTTHGATAALLNDTGQLALPILDYEFDGYGALAKNYDAVRPDFSQTGSPRLPMGLNLGAQIYWLERNFPQEFLKTRHIVMYPQYWSYRFTGVASNEVTSLGCHTDLWNPLLGDYSDLVETMKWRRLFAPMRRAADVLGSITADVAQQTGLAPKTPVVVGIHDSNASVVPHLLQHSKPFAVVSTGTWVVCMAIGEHQKPLDKNRDTLINVNAFGGAMPSARFMGGREFEMLSQGRNETYTIEDVDAVLAGLAFLLPSVVEGSGPYPQHKHQWIGAPEAGQIHVALSFYLALMTATCLDLIGAEGEIILEGPFLKNELFKLMLEAAAGRCVVGGQSGSTGTTIGAALLFSSGAPRPMIKSQESVAKLSLYKTYAQKWKELVKASNIKSA